MQATISNQIYLNDLTFEQTLRIKNALAFKNPKYTEAVNFGRSARDICPVIQLFEETYDGLMIPRGVSLKKLGVKADELRDNRHSRPVMIDSIIEPRTYQERALRLMTAAGSGVLVAPTGSGKTTIGIELASRLGERCLILVKSNDLAEQWIISIKKFTGLDAGLIGGGKWREGERFTVGLIQTLIKYEDSLDYGLVIADECHNIPSQQAYTVINRQSAKYRYGLSATPQRRDNLEFMLHAALGPVVAEIESKEVGGSVLPVSVSTLQYNFQGSPESWTEFLRDLANDDERNRVIIAAAIKSSRKMGTAVLCGTVDHCEALANMAKEHGVNALVLHGQLPTKLREARMLAAENSQLIIGTLGLLSEGIDWPHIGGVIFASPVSAVLNKDKASAATRLLQSIGRARRPYPGQTQANVLDIVDNHPFGKSAAYKRQQIYQQQGFAVRAI